MKQIKMVNRYRTIEISVPERYSEMNGKQLLAAVRFSLEEIDAVDFYKAMGIPRSWQRKLKLFCLFEIQHILGFLYALEEPCDHFIIPKIMRGKMVAPEKRLAGMSLQQFMTVDSYFSYYSCTENEEFLVNMMAAIYLKQKEAFVIDERHPVLLNIEKRVLYLKDKTDKALLRATYLNWILIKNWLSKEFKFLFPKSVSEEIQKPQPVDWLKIFDAFVGENIPQSEYYQAMECMNAFRILNEKIRQQQETNKL